MSIITTYDHVYRLFIEIFTHRRRRRVSDSVLVADGDCRKSDFFRVLNPEVDADRSRQVITDAILDLIRGERSSDEQQQDPDGPSERR